MVDVSRRKTPPREAQLRDAIELFYFAYRSFTAEPDRILAEYGLGRAHHRILYFVGRHPDVAVNALLELLAVSKQALHAPLRKLLDGKWISTRPDAQDRRVKRLRLTQAGTDLEARLTGAQLKHLGTVFSTANDRAEEGWKSVMRAMSERLG
jgi:DNA-binding MarR family transcriptional regulator